MPTRYIDNRYQLFTNLKSFLAAVKVDDFRMNLVSQLNGANRKDAMKRTKYVVSAVVVLLGLSLLFSTAVTRVYAATPIIYLKPDRGTVNRIVTISNKGGFDHNVTITIKFDSEIVATTMSNSSGGFSTTFKVPQAVVGIHTVTATGGTITASQTFTVVTNIAIVPKSGHVGRTVKINGTGFAASSTIKITFNSVLVDTTESNSTGGFSTSIAIPDDSAGSYSIVATDASGDNASSTFTIV